PATVPRLARRFGELLDGADITSGAKHEPELLAQLEPRRHGVDGIEALGQNKAPLKTGDRLVGGTALNRISRGLSIVAASTPRCAGELEMPRELGCDRCRAMAIESLYALRDASMQFLPAGWRQPLVKHLLVQAVGEGVPLGDARPEQLRRAAGHQKVLSLCQSLAASLGLQVIDGERMGEDRG